MKILHIINRLGAAGAETMLFNLAQSLRQDSLEQEVITLMPGGGLCDKFIKKGFSVNHLGMRQGFPSIRALWSLSRHVHRVKPDIVMGWLYHSSFAATFVVPRNIPIIWGVHHTLTRMQEEKFLTRVLIENGPRLKHRVSRYVYVSELGARQHQALGYPEDKSVVIPNGFDLKKFQRDDLVRATVRKELSLEDHQIVFGCAGRYNENKNQLGLVRAFGKLALINPNVILVLLGHGVDGSNRQLIELIQEFNVQERVILLGIRDDVYRVMTALDIYISPSKWFEAFPLVLGEAMATEIPCIATDLGDCAQIIGDTGLLIPPDNEQALQEAMAKMVKLSAEQRYRLGYSARAQIREKFDLASIADRYRELFRELVPVPKN